MSVTMKLPSLRSKPSYKDLSKILIGLELKPRSWDEIPAQSLADQLRFDEEDVQAFLLGLFKTDFWWFEDLKGENLEAITAQQQVDEIVDLASRRLAERCGRSGMTPVSLQRIVMQYAWQSSVCFPSLFIANKCLCSPRSGCQEVSPRCRSRSWCQLRCWKTYSSTRTIHS